MPEDSPSGADLAIQENVSGIAPRREEEKPQYVMCSDFKSSDSKAGFAWRRNAPPLQLGELASGSSEAARTLGGSGPPATIACSRPSFRSNLGEFSDGWVACRFQRHCGRASEKIDLMKICTDYLSGCVCRREPVAPNFSRSVGRIVGPRQEATDRLPRSTFSPLSSVIAVQNLQSTLYSKHAKD